VASLSVRLQPKSSQARIERLDHLNFKVWVMAPPVDGQANEALVELLSKDLGVAKSRIHLVSGHTSRQKVVRIDEMSDNEVIARYPKSR
jgi:uncharacterized protein (TIGR00251 family)